MVLLIAATRGLLQWVDNQLPKPHNKIDRVQEATTQMYYHMVLQLGKKHG